MHVLLDISKVKWFYTRSLFICLRLQDLYTKVRQCHHLNADIDKGLRSCPVKKVLISHCVWETIRYTIGCIKYTSVYGVFRCWLHVELVSSNQVHARQFQGGQVILKLTRNIDKPNTMDKKKSRKIAKVTVRTCKLEAPLREWLTRAQGNIAQFMTVGHALPEANQLDHITLSLIGSSVT